MEGSSSCTRYDMVLAVKVEPVEEHLSPDGTRIHESTWGNSYFTHFSYNWDHTYAKLGSPPTEVSVKLESEDETSEDETSEDETSEESEEDEVCVTGPRGVSEAAILAGLYSDSGSPRGVSEAAALAGLYSDSGSPRGVSEAAALAGLYADHAVKDELVVGPERPHRPLIALIHDGAHSVSTWSQESAREPYDLALMDCSLKLERCDTHGTASEPSAEHIAPQTHDTVPQTTHDSMPRITHDTVTQNTHDIVPQTTCDTVPQDTHDTVPQNTKDTAPQNTHDTLQHAATNTYVCDICGKTIKRKDHLIRHINWHLRVNSKTISNKANFYERVCTNIKPHCCKTCNKDFTTLDNLQRHTHNTHERIHTGVKPYSCNICRKQLTTLANLTIHKRIHTGEKPYSCNICKKRFAELGTLKKHKRIHTGEKPYACKVCSKMYAYCFTLERHKRIHSGARPYTCEICEKGFMRSDTLKKHLIFHMGNKSKAKEKKLTDEAHSVSTWSQESAREPYDDLALMDCSLKIERCDTHGTASEPSAKHIAPQTHDTVPQIKPHCCKICNKDFTRLDHLQRHERIHTGEKPYSCNICKNQFAELSNLKRHKRIHTGEKKPCSGKKYAREVCSKMFPYLFPLERH